MEAGQIVIRTLEPEDLFYLYIWRLDPDTVANSISQEPTWEAHCLHFENLLYDQEFNNLYCAVALCSGIPAGILTVSEHDQVSIMVSSLFRRRGVATVLLKTAQREGFYMEAFVKDKNLASHRLFTKLGFMYNRREVTLAGVVYSWTPTKEAA
jgi:ribosomal protein S18 acetylase RimI-like enzyme